MDTALLVALSALIGALVKTFADLLIAVWKGKADQKTGAINADSAVRDDILALVDKYEAREARLVATLDKKDTQIDTLQAAVAKLLDDNSELRAEKRQFQYESLERERENNRLKEELAKFERKVFYVRQSIDTDDTKLGEKKE
jgi:DNA repair exonuclease SbcCD ATPase subunit